STGCVITGCTALANDTAAFAVSSGNIMTGCNARLSATGVRVTGQGNKIEDNLVTACPLGVDMTGGTLNFVTRNTVIGADSAFLGWPQTNNRVAPIQTGVSFEGVNPFTNVAY